MSRNPNTPLGPGCLMVVAILIGTLIGLRMHQSSLGIVLGAATALAILGLFWLLDRLR